MFTGDDPHESRLSNEALKMDADALMASADAIYEHIGPRPSIMVCEPCAAERKRTNGCYYVHELVEEHRERAAKRRRVV